MDNNKKHHSIPVEKLTVLNDFPGMIFFLTRKNEIKYANPAAKNFLAQERHKKELFSSIFTLIEAKKTREIEKISVNNTPMELGITPTDNGSKNPSYWISLRYINKTEKQLEELTLSYNSLQQRITAKEKELDRSRQDRKRLESKLQTLESHLQQTPADNNMVGSSQALKQLQKMALQVAKTDATILITGESGTGKELIANLIQKNSNRCNKPFLTINCNTISESLLESDLFGHEKGAFTGASTRQKGKFEEVNGGTIFLDEIGDISPKMQAALLRILQNQEIIRVGGNKTIKVNVRIIAATNRNLEEMVANGTFRLDLFYRLNIINLIVPPLRERKEDIVDLTTHFIRKYRASFGRKISFLPQPVLDKLLLHNWPGNVRELENVIQRAVLMARDNSISKEDLQFNNLGLPAAREDSGTTSLTKAEIDKPLKETIALIEKELISASLRRHRGNVSAVSKGLVLGKTALYDKMKRYNISAKSFK